MKTRTKNRLMAASGLLLLAALLHYLLRGPGLILNLSLLAASVIAGFPIAVKAFKTALMKTFSIDLLVSIAVLGALFIGEYLESAVVSFLFLFGDFLESRSLEKARSSIKNLFQKQPKMATLIRQGAEINVPATAIEVGDLVVLRAGSVVPVDGKILEGEAHLNEATITGESLPVRKKPGDSVYSSSILDSGYLLVAAEKVGEDTSFARILELVEEAQDSKASAQRYLERFASYYTPGILLLSVLLLLFTRDLHLSLTFLVIACPGALIIAAPVSIVAGIGSGARKGILIKGGHVMERLSRINAVLFDKTGTLTKGTPEVSAIRTFGISKEKLLKMAAEAEIASEHHLGRAIVQKAKSEGLKLQHKPEQVEIIKGGGLKAWIGDSKMSIGNRELLLKEGVRIPPEAETYAATREMEGSTAVFVAVNKQLRGIIGIKDQIRENAPQSLTQLREHGIKHILMLTGDNRRTALKVAQELNIPQVIPELLPEDKAERVKACMTKNMQLAMVGDGVNDAPALATADVGIAMGGAATEVALETADVVLLSGKLNKLNEALQLAKATVRNMKQNMYFSVGVVILLLFGVLNGKVHLASGMLIHEVSVLLVILNALRLVRFPRYQLQIRKRLREIQASFYFPSIWSEKKHQRAMKVNGCTATSPEEFENCARC